MGERILLAGGGTGGHLYPSLNLAAALRRASPEVEVLLVGATRGIEARLLPEAGPPYVLLPMEPLYRTEPWRNWRHVPSLPRVGFGLRKAFRDFDPDLVVGTGGYASLPAVALALATGRRTALQEQNAQPGLVTKLLAPFVDQLHLGYPEARHRLRPGRKTEVFAHGNPVAFEAPRDPFPWPEPPVVAVIGGSQGARGLNEIVLRDLEGATSWPGGASLVWSTGPTHRAEVAARVARLPFAERIRVVSFVPGLGAQLDAVTVAVCRAGAMFCAELAAAGVPAVFVPFPAAAAHHQRHNALALAEAGAALVFEEGTLASGELWEVVLGLLREESRLLRMSRAMRARGRPEAADRTARELLRLLSSERGEHGGDG